MRWGSRIAPWFAEWYLAKTGVKGQQSEPKIGGRDGNLFDALPQDPGAHGRYDEQAHPRSLELAVAKHRTAAALAILAACGLTAMRRFATMR